MLKLPDLLIVEDDDGLHSQYSWALKKDYVVHFSTDRVSAISDFRKIRPAVVLLDLGLPPDPSNASEGLATLREILEVEPLTQVVILTGSEQRSHALDAVAMGASDFQSKGISNDDLKFALQRAYRMHSLQVENDKLKKQSLPSGNGVIGEHPHFIEALKRTEKIAATSVSALLLGESGVGKEVFAQHLHAKSGRKGDFVAINCAAIPAELLESELFGHEKGAFTSAHQLSIGKIERANGGTLFLDEIGDMPLVLQAKLLRFLQEREIERIGGKKSIQVDVRVVCATHRDLAEMAKKKDFREDLFYRISEVSVNIPALRMRGNDIKLLANYFLQQCVSEFSGSATRFSDDAVAAMMLYSWPGNIRELQNKIKSAVIMSERSLIYAKDLYISTKENQLFLPETWLNDVENRDLSDIISLADARKAAETRALFKAYQKSQGNICVAAESLGITRPTFYAIANKHGLFLNRQEGKPE